jgi:Fe-S-cluster-containing dehydrogenase component
VPPCVHNCSCGARYFGDLDNPASGAAMAVAAAGADKCHHLYDPTDNKPATVYILSPEIATWKELKK